MSKKKQKKLSRNDLLKILLEQRREIRQLEAQLMENGVKLEGQLPSEKQNDMIEEADRLKDRIRFFSILRHTIATLIVVAAVAVLVATIWLPVLQIYGSSMTPTLEAGDIVLSVKGSDFEQGDLIAFYLGNKILIKRCIALPGQWVDLDEAGNVYIDGILLEEPYLDEKSFGDANIDLPYQVPENRYFCMGDHRETSVDSRHTEVGCVSEEQIVGEIMFRIWPLDRCGAL